ncbi:MAG: hypothetical protein ABI565_00325 [Vicinamibacteria bacterium]
MTGHGRWSMAAAMLLMAFAASVQPARYDQAPEFPSQDPKEWIGPPQSLKALAGKVVILDVWTFG